MDDTFRRNMPLFPIGIVMKLTGLSARQIRYYEQHKLVMPARTAGNQRLFSFNDVERLLEIKSLIDKGLNIAGIKQMLSAADPSSRDAEERDEPAETKRTELSERELHNILKKELMAGNLKGRKTSLIQGELARFLNQQ